MPQDKQLDSVKLDDVLEKRRLDQALNAKEFAVLVGVSYSTAREWFRMPGFPVIRGLIFWGDFVEWRRVLTGLNGNGEQHRAGENRQPAASMPKPVLGLPPRAMRLLAEVG
jgi:hypothetical protein